MTERAIEREAWPSFGTTFSRQHQGWLASIERDRRPLSDLQPLEGVTIHGARAEVRLGDRAYEIDDLKEVRIVAAEDDPTAIQRVEFVASDQTLALRFRTAIAPELVDGAV